MRHPRDPAAPHEAARRFGLWAAQGLIAPEECRAALAAAAAVAPGVDRAGLRARLMQGFAAAAAAASGRRRALFWELGSVLQPGFAARMSRGTLLDRAAAANRAAGGVLRPRELGVALLFHLGRFLREDRHDR